MADTIQPAASSLRRVFLNHRPKGLTISILTGPGAQIPLAFANISEWPQLIIIYDAADARSWFSQITAHQYEVVEDNPTSQLVILRQSSLKTRDIYCYDLPGEGGQSYQVIGLDLLLLPEVYSRPLHIIACLINPDQAESHLELIQQIIRESKTPDILLAGQLGLLDPPPRAGTSPGFRDLWSLAGGIKELKRVSARVRGPRVWSLSQRPGFSPVVDQYRLTQECLQIKAFLPK
jgi:hypothetical protein